MDGPQQHHQPQQPQATNPVSMESPNLTPHDLYCQAKEYERRNRLHDAADLYLKASMNGHLSAMVAYATHLVPTDERAAFVWFRAAAERGDPRAWYELGQLLARGRYFEVNAIDAARCWKRAAQMGDNTGKSALGLCYIRGFGVKQDAKKGVEIVKQVADVQNDVTAMKNLAWIYKHGKGVDEDPTTATYWEKRARKQEEIMRQVNTREHELFGKGRSRSSRHKRDSNNNNASSNNQSNNISTSPATDDNSNKRDNNASDSSQRFSKDKDSLHSSQSKSDDPRPSSRTPDSMHPEQSFSPNPVRGSHLPSSLQEDARFDQSGLRDDAQPQNTDNNNNYIDERIIKKQADPTLGAEVADLSFISKDKDTESPRNDDVDQNREFSPYDNTSSREQPKHDRTPSVGGPFESEMTQWDTDRTRMNERGIPQVGSKISDSIHDEEREDEDQVADQDADQEGYDHHEEADDFDEGHGEQHRYDNSVNPSQNYVKGGIGGEYDGNDDTDEDSEAGNEDGRRTNNDNDNIRDRNVDNSGANEDSKNDPLVGATTFSSNQNSALDFHNEQLLREKSQSQQGLFRVEPPVNLGPGVSSRKKYFESDNETRQTSVSNTPHGQSGITGLTSLSGGEDNNHNRNSSYSERALHPAGGEAEGDSNRIMPDDEDIHDDGSRGEVPNYGHEYEDVEEDDGKHLDFSSHINNDHRNYDNHVGHSTIPAANNTTLPIDEGPPTETTQNTDTMVQRVTQNGLTPADRNAHVDAGALERLHQVLVNYPQNPLRADAQPVLGTLVKTIQDISVSNVDAYSIIEKDLGFYKVVVAMLSQHEDEHIQEHGLHCLLRILRAMQTSTKESSILTAYGDCFKIVQGNEDVIVPKGTVGVREERSGAVQAVANAMRYHSTIRRIQLAGCATMNEIAATSPSCRSVCLEQSCVSLLMSCLRHRSTPSAAVIHEMAGRAVSSFCNGKESLIFKEAFSNAGAVPELLNILQLWGHNDEAMSDLMTNATVCCCGALRHVAEGYDPASIQAVQSFAYHHLIRIMVLRKDDVAVCTVVLGALTAITRNAGSAAEKPLMDVKPLPEVLGTMQVHSQNALFIRKALDFMEALGAYAVMREEIVVAGGIQFASDIIQQGGNDILLLEKACAVIDRLCKGSAPNQEIFASHNGLKSLTALLSSQSRQPGVVERALNATASVSSNNAASQREALRASAPEELVRILSIYSSKNAKVVAACTGAMSALVVPKNMAMARTFAESKAPELVVRAMKRHPDNVTVQENSSSAVAAFCEADPHIMSSLLKSGITTSLVVALQRFLHKQSAVVQIVRAMRAITNEVIPEDSYRFKSKLLTDQSNESSLPEIFHTALSFHKKSLPDSSNVIISICATINRLCMRSVAFKNEVGKDGIVEELKRLVERTAEFKDLGALQPVLATICTLVLESEENKNRFHSVGGVEAILDVMQKWKHDTYVLEHCCAALRYSCNDHFGNCDEVKNHNGVRSILGVMEMHPENVNVTLWCCLTLADLCKGDEELQSSATVVQGIRKVISAMNMFSTNSRFLSSACEFLRAASACNADNQERIVRLGGRSAMVHALESHPTDSTLTESASYALLQVQDIADPRTSVDSSPQLGLVKRISRDLRRSGSSSNRSNRSSKNRIGRKSLSFTSRRRTDDSAAASSDKHGSQNQSGDDERSSNSKNGRPVKNSSFINLQRLIPRRRNRSAPASADADMQQQRHNPRHAEHDRGDGYGEYDDDEEEVDDHDLHDGEDDDDDDGPYEDAHDRHRHGVDMDHRR